MTSESIEQYVDAMHQYRDQMHLEKTDKISAIIKDDKIKWTSLPKMAIKKKTIVKKLCDIFLLIKLYEDIIYGRVTYEMGILGYAIYTEDYRCFMSLPDPGYQIQTISYMDPADIDQLMYIISRYICHALTIQDKEKMIWVIDIFKSWYEVFS